MSTAYGLDPAQLARLIVKPTLLGIGLWAAEAGPLVLGSGMKESHLIHLRQMSGPAIGIYQMEPPTYLDIRRNFLAHRGALRAAVDAFAIGDPEAEQMTGNLYFATAMCRVHYRRVPEPLPDATDALGMAHYWKRYYNTAAGKGTVEEALPHFQAAINIFYPGASS